MLTSHYEFSGVPAIKIVGEHAADPTRRVEQGSSVHDIWTLLFEMKLESVKVRNFLTFDENGAEVRDLGDVVLVVGPNGAGKSSFLRAIEYLGTALVRSPPWAGSHVHGQDISRGLSIDVGVRLSPKEKELATTAMMLAFHRDWHAPARDQAKIDTNRATAAIHEVIERCTPHFSSWFDGAVRFCVFSRPGVAQEIVTHVTMKVPGGELCLDDQGRLGKAPHNSNSWGNADLSEEIFERLARLADGAFENKTPRTPIPNGLIESVAKSIEPEWFYRALEQRGDYPMAHRLEDLNISNRNQRLGSAAAEAALQLEIFLRSRGEDASKQRITAHRVLGQIFAAGLSLLSDDRTKLAALGEGHKWIAFESDRPVLSRSLPRDLFEMKNSLRPWDRERFWNLCEVMESLTGIRIDVGLDSRTSPPSSQGSRETSVRVPVLSFDADGLSYPGFLAASGHCELLSVLHSVLSNSSAVVLLDEPALNLHPVKQREVLDAIVSLSREAGNQLVIITHSPSFVRAADLPGALRFTRRDGHAHVDTLKTLETADQTRLSKLVQTAPAILGALFSHRVVLVEGESEELSLPVWFTVCSSPANVEAGGVLFLGVHGKSGFSSYSRILDAWGVPWRMIGDGDSVRELAKFGDKGAHYPQTDFQVLLDERCKDTYHRLQAELGLKRDDPYLARAVASATPPPPEVLSIWDAIGPFIRGETEPQKALITSPTADGSSMAGEN